MVKNKFRETTPFKIDALFQFAPSSKKKNNQNNDFTLC